ncbi:proton-coupled amino acid transporter-like protein CG1139 [Nilaparvata lugens]|uniref:proton-coupled amino acid transporter-like protein CG1139 n=1 Tax=Nilaparvata lugens TaxID=108931 RepID=UPI00193E6C71|nr:proton-coupled amino acid transporter-like protein CG1139 [Nilaparvata lugens]
MTASSPKELQQNRSLEKDAELEKGKGGGHGLPPNKHPTSFIETLVHLLKGFVGSGVFALGEGFKNVGLILGTVLTVFIGIACVYCEHILLKCSTTLKKRRKLSYYPDFAETVEMCFEEGPQSLRKFAKFTGSITYFMIIFMQFGFCCVYILFISNTSKYISDSYGLNLDLRVHMCIMMVPLILSSLVRSLKYIVPISLTANLCMIFGIASTMYIVMQDLPPVSSRRYIGDLGNVPLFFGTAVYSFEGIGLVLPLKREMKNPKHFDRPLGVLNLGLVIIVSIFLMMGFFSYLKYGDDIQASVTLNLPEKLVLSQMVRVAIGIGILFTYALMFYVPIELIWPRIAARFGPLSKPLLSELIFRIFMVFVTI